MAMTPAQIRQARLDDPKLRARDFAAANGITEAHLVAAMVGHGTTRIEPHPDRLFPLLEALGEVMALTRNESCVSEKVGTYTGFHAGPHASMVVGDVIDMRMFPAHWVHGYAVTDGDKRSIQIFDAAGDAVHKVHLRPASNVAAFDALVDALRLPDQDTVDVTPRTPTELAKGDATRADALRVEWEAMTDTHQFLKLTRKLKMNRLGANRTVGAPHAIPLATTAVTQVLELAAERRVPVMIFVGNQGCIQIHGGPVEKIAVMGPWINVLDPGFDLHLRQDHVAEVWLVTKPTQRGPAISVECFDKDGMLIAQIFGYKKNTPAEPWEALVADLARETEAV